MTDATSGTKRRIGSGRMIAGVLVLALIAAALIALSSWVADTDAGNDSTPEVAWPSEDEGDDREVAVAASPDGGLRVELTTLGGGRIVYRVVLDGPDDEAGAEVEVVAPSTLGVQTREIDLSTDLQTVEMTRPEPWRSSFRAAAGKRSNSDLEGNLVTVRFDHPSTGDVPVDLEVDLLATDEGVGIRQRVLGPEGRSIIVDWERSTFTVSPEAISWMQPNDPPSMWTPAYERLRSPATPVGRLPDQVSGWTLPALFRDDDRWLLVAESGVKPPMAGQHLAPERTGGTFLFDPPQPGEGDGVGEVAITAPSPVTLPWHVFVVGRDLAAIAETDLVRHLSEPGPDDPPPWIEPGRVSWSWWSDHNSPQDAERLTDFVDLAGEMGWEYSLVDANWPVLPDGTIESLVERAAGQGVELLLWYNSGGPHNEVTEAPRELMADPEVRRAEMARIRELGVAGIKVDFFHSDKPTSIRLYHDILADAADHELLVVFHGSTMPRGWSRTYPHLMTMESVRGAEVYTFDSSYAGQAPGQNVALPFTRNVVGSMDYTPVILSDEFAPGRLTTNAHELALAVVFESGLQHFVDTPESYLTQPDEVIEYLRRVPVAWDETVLLGGDPDRYAALARRVDDHPNSGWWVGAINGTDETIDVELPTDRIETGRHLAICDGADPRSYRIDTVTLPTTVTLAPYGGCALMPTP